jgi:hypothetical protein
MQLKRLFRHLLLPHWWVLRVFPPSLLQQSSRRSGLGVGAFGGELRVVVEANLPLTGLWRAQSARGGRSSLFSQLRVWDTEQNSGVLIYLQLIDRRVEIVADRGIDARVGQDRSGTESAVGWRQLSATGDFEAWNGACPADTITEALPNTSLRMLKSRQRVTGCAAAALAFGIAHALARLVRLSQVIERQDVRLL